MNELHLNPLVWKCSDMLLAKILIFSQRTADEQGRSEANEFVPLCRNNQDCKKLWFLVCLGHSEVGWLCRFPFQIGV